MSSQTADAAGRGDYVRMARFTVFLRPETQPLMADLIPFISELRPRYPDVTEEAPYPTLGGPHPMQFVGSGDEWPIPFTTMTDPQTGRFVLYQSDRIAIGWNADVRSDEDSRYPGYEELSAELLQIIDLFTESLQESSGAVAVQSAECKYVNIFEGISAASLAAARLGASFDDQNSAQPEEFSLHFHADPEHGEPNWQTMETDAAGVQLTIQARTDDREWAQREDSAEPQEVLRRAHDQCANSYQQWVSYLRQGEK